MKQQGFSLPILIFLILLLASVSILSLGFFKKTILAPWKSFEGKACNFGGCYTSEMNQKYNYWLAQAIEKKDDALCENVEGLYNGDYRDSKEIAIYFCKAEFGGKNGDTHYCGQLDNFVKYQGTATQQYVCFSKIATSTQYTEVCDKLPTDSYPVNVRYECYASVAEKKDDPAICQKIPDQEYSTVRGSRFNCLLALGKKLKDPKLCYNTSDTRTIVQCIETMAFDLKDPSICDALKVDPYYGKPEHCKNALK